MREKLKNLQAALLILLFMAMTGCQKQGQDKRAQMQLDSEAPDKSVDKSVTAVRAKEAARPAESVTDIKELPNITQYDIDAAQRTPSKEVVYVKPGEAVRPSEKKQ